MLVYGLCLVFCIHYLTDLNAKRYTTYFEMKETNFSRPNLSLCFPLYIRFEFNCSAADSELLRSGCARFFQLYQYYNDESDTTRTPKTILEYANELRLNESYTVSEGYRFEAYYLNFNYLCLKYSLREAPPRQDGEEDEDEERTFSVAVRNNYNLPSFVFFHKENFIYFFYNYFFRQRNCEIFRSCKSFEFQIEQYQFIFQKAPYGERCLDYKQMQFPDYANPVDNEEIGLFECIKQKTDRPISLLFFTSNDVKKFLYLPTNYASSPILKQLPKSGIYRNCSRKFARRDCNKVIHIITEQKNTDDRDNLTFHFKELAKLVNEAGFLTEFDFWLQVLGFISLIFGISLNSSLNYISTSITIHFSPKLLFSNLVFVVKYFLVLVGLYVVLGKTMQMICSYRNQAIYTVIHYNLFEHKEVNLYLCFPVASTVKGHKQIDDRELANATTDLLVNHTLKQLLKMRLPPSSLIERIHLTDGRRQSNLSIQAFKSETFRMAKYESISTHIFSKCFNYHIKLSLPSYQRLLKSTALKIRFKVNLTAFFFTDIHQPVVRSDAQLVPTDYISRYEFISNKYQCLDYRRTVHKAVNGSFSCVSQENCLDECVIEQYRKDFGHLSVLSVIHSNNFHKFADLKFSHNSNHTHFDYEQHIGGEEHREGFLKLENECRQRFAEKDCNTVRYQSMNKKVTVQRERGEIRFDMSFLNQIYRQNEYLTIIPFISNLLTLWCIMIDVSFSNLFGLLLSWVRGKLKKDLTIAFLNSKLSGYQARQLQFKVLRLLKGLLVFLLFLGSLVIIFQTYDNELIQSNYFDTTTDQFDFPVTGFCFDLCERYKNKDENLTGNKLNALTSKLAINGILDRVEYINSLHRNTTWTQGEQFDKNIRIEHFYYLKKKCFSFNYDLNTTDDAHLLTDYALRIYFKPNLKFKTIYYFTKVKYEESFSQFHNLNASSFMYTIRFGSV